MSLCYAQDVIYKKDNTIIKCKIKEITIEKIKYKNIEIRKSPLFEILISEVSRIQFNNGYVQNYTVPAMTDTSNDFSHQIEINSIKKIDTSNFSTIYFVFNQGYDQDQIFPIYINGHFLYNMRNKMRLEYKIFSQGLIMIERVHSRKFGPRTEFNIDSGKSYGIRIKIQDISNRNPSLRFALETINNKNEVEIFLKDEFYGFKPFKTYDIKLLEDITNPIVK